METTSTKYTRSSHMIPKSVVTNLAVNQKSPYMPNNSQMSNAAEQKLLEQFVYFKEEFLDTALSLDIPIPLDLVENKSQLLKPFLKSNGPKYVFQIIQSNLGNIQLLRSGISLMITTLAILKRNLPKQYSSYTPESPQFSMYSEKDAHYTPDEQKAIQAIAKIGDVVTVPSVVSILLCTHNPLIQELLYSLLAGLVSISDDAITQMFQVPNIMNHQSSSSSNNNNNNTNTTNIANISSGDSTRDRMLSIHLKKLNSRASLISELGSPLATSSNNGTNFFTNGNNESIRKSFMSTTGGGGGGNGVVNSGTNAGQFANPNLPAANLAVEPSASMRYALRLDRGNSKARLSDLNSEDRPEETNCCLQYLLSILLVQKNRHLLYAGFADIIIAMTKASTSTVSLNAIVPLCEVIARSPTVELPMLDTQKSAANQHGHLKHLYSNTQQTPESIPINPLGNRVIDWAGIKIPLKFLQKYYKLFSSHHDLPGSRHRSRAPSGGGGNGASSAAHQDKIISDSIRKEYQYAHNRTLLAICCLIVGAPSIASHIATLSGAIDLIQWSSGIYEDEESSAGPSGGSGGGGYSYRSNDSTGSNHQLPIVIQQALQYLQIEKQNLRRSKAAAAAAGTIATSGSHGPLSTLTKGSSNNGFGSNCGSIASGNNSSQQSFPVGNGNHGTQSKPNSAPSGQNTGRRTGSSQHSKRLKPLDVHPSVPLKSSDSPTQIKRHVVENVSLTTTMQQAFGQDYVIDTEQYKLYLQNRMDTLRRDRTLSPMQWNAAEIMKAQAQGPLQRQNLQYDSLLNASLNVISNQANQTLRGAPPTTSQSQSQFPASSKTATTGVTTATKSTVDSQAGHLLSWSFAPTEPTQGDPATVTHVTDPTYLMDPAAGGGATGLSAYHDFFSHLPRVPYVPQRIEAKDAIALSQDMTTIRKKFQILAEEAAAKIKNSGDVLRNGKNLVTIEERARRVYSPKKSAFAASMPQTNKLSHNDNDDEASELIQPSNNSGLNIQTNSTMSQPLSLEHLTPPLLAPQPPTGSAKSMPGTAGDPDKTPAWNPLKPQDVQAQNQYYGLRLDNVEFEEENALFNNFKPIFEYDTVIPAEDSTKNQGAFSTGGLKVSKAKLTMQLDQSEDIALQ